MENKDSWDIKISDFGLSRLLDVDSELLTTMCGTPLFLAPEVLQSRQRGGYGFEVDYWSMGVILYLMLVGHPPYNEKDGQMLELVRDGRFSFPKQTWSAVSETGLDIVQRLMCVNPEKRLTGEQMRHHPWILGMDDFPQWYDSDQEDPFIRGFPNLNGIINNNTNTNNNNNNNNNNNVANGFHSNSNNNQNKNINRFSPQFISDDQKQQPPPPQQQQARQQQQRQQHQQQPQPQQGRPRQNKKINKPAMQLFGVSTTAAQRLQSQSQKQSARMSYDEAGPMENGNYNDNNNNNNNNHRNRTGNIQNQITGKKRSALQRDITMTRDKSNNNRNNNMNNYNNNHNNNNNNHRLAAIDETGNNGNDNGNGNEDEDEDDSGVFHAPPKKRQRVNGQGQRLMSMDSQVIADGMRSLQKKAERRKRNLNRNRNKGDSSSDDSDSDDDDNGSQRSNYSQLTPLDSINEKPAVFMNLSQSDSNVSDENDNNGHEMQDDDVRGLLKSNTNKNVNLNRNRGRQAKANSHNRNNGNSNGNGNGSGNNRNNGGRGGRKGRYKEMSVDEEMI